jgi:hypothetical protein
MLAAGGPIAKLEPRPGEDGECNREIREIREMPERDYKDRKNGADGTGSFNAETPRTRRRRRGQEPILLRQKHYGGQDIAGPKPKQPARKGKGLTTDVTDCTDGKKAERWRQRNRALQWKNCGHGGELLFDWRTTAYVLAEDVTLLGLPLLFQFRCLPFLPRFHL